jgi:hypothetical protein
LLPQGLDLLLPVVGTLLLGTAAILDTIIGPAT